MSDLHEQLSTIRPDMVEYLENCRYRHTGQNVTYFAGCPACGQETLWQSVRRWKDQHKTLAYCPCPPQRTEPAKETS